MNNLITIQLCAFCKHDLGLHFICPTCNRPQELPFSYTAQNRIFCEDCMNGEVTSPLAVTCESPEEEGTHHVCQRNIKAGTSIEEVNPVTRQIEKSYLLPAEFPLYPNNIVDTYYLEGGIKICRFCRYIPPSIGRYYPEVLLAMLCEKDMESVITEYYQIFPILNSLFPLETRRGETVEDWVEKVRGLAVEEILKNLRKTPLLFTTKKEKVRLIAADAENRLYFDIICRDAFPDPDLIDE